MAKLIINISDIEFNDNANKRRVDAELRIYDSASSILCYVSDKDGKCYPVPTLSDCNGVFPELHIDHKEHPKIRVEVRDGIGDIVYIMDNVSVVDSYDQIPECEALA